MIVVEFNQKVLPVLELSLPAWALQPPLFKVDKKNGLDVLYYEPKRDKFGALL